MALRAISKMEMRYCRELLGNEWVDATIVAKEGTHRLTQWYKRSADDLWLKYTDHLIRDVLNSPSIAFNREVLANKLKSKGDFVSTLAEMESAIRLTQQGFTVTLEPSAPEKGPDIRADLKSVPYFIEIRTVGLSEEETRRDDVTNEIFAKLNDTPSTFRVALTVGREYRRGTARLRDAIKAVVSCLDILRERGSREGKLYFANVNESVLVLPGANLTERHHAIMQKADLIAEFDHTGTQQRGTPASVMQPHKSPPEPVRDHERLRRILEQKRSQLPKGERGIIVLEVSEIFMLSDFSINSALYGDLVIRFQRVGPHESVGPAEQSRNNRGFLLHTSRVSAVVIQNRSVQNGEITNQWRVYPTNRAFTDTIRLGLEELRLLGDVEDREHLYAEKVDPDRM
jgi:hypothetical protein